MATITVCMGSSCFSRGNAMNAEIVQKFLADKGLTDKVYVKGCLCDGQCKNGPNLHINDKLFSHVSPESLEDLLTHELEALL
ncbi:(2Fe-2S) ferredoxin domain-containing protein [Treponema sp. HNW]|uniref:(2Fe-2S) ferredoxin domain-containing protein n=1 Tax=Treponema sp. HNW TaxID=3116654 RepID=UPI003D0CD970